MNTRLASLAAHPFVRGLVSGTSRLFDILSPRVTLPLRSPEDDARNLYGDMARIGGDFDRVFARILKDSAK